MSYPGTDAPLNALSHATEKKRKSVTEYDVILERAYLAYA